MAAAHIPHSLRAHLHTDFPIPRPHPCLMWQETKVTLFLQFALFFGDYGRQELVYRHYFDFCLNSEAAT